MAFPCRRPPAIGVALSALGALSVPLAAPAQGRPAVPAGTTAAAAAPLASLMQGIFALLVVVALIFVASWLMRKVGPRARSGGVVQVLGGASVGPREKVVVVRFGTKTLLLGVAPGHVGLLHATDALDAPPIADDREAGPAPSFVERLRAARGRA